MTTVSLALDAIVCNCALLELSAAADQRSSCLHLYIRSSTLACPGLAAVFGTAAEPQRLIRHLHAEVSAKGRRGCYPRRRARALVPGSSIRQDCILLEVQPPNFLGILTHPAQRQGRESSECQQQDTQHRMSGAFNAYGGNSKLAAVSA